MQKLHNTVRDGVDTEAPVCLLQVALDNPRSL